MSGSLRKWAQRPGTPGESLMTFVCGYQDHLLQPHLTEMWYWYWWEKYHSRNRGMKSTNQVDEVYICKLQIGLTRHVSVHQDFSCGNKGPSLAHPVHSDPHLLTLGKISVTCTEARGLQGLSGLKRQILGMWVNSYHPIKTFAEKNMMQQGCQSSFLEFHSPGFYSNPDCSCDGSFDIDIQLTTTIIIHYNWLTLTMVDSYWPWLTHSFFMFFR